MRMRPAHVAGIALLAALAASALLNAILYRRARDVYRELQLVRIDPSGRAAYEEANAALKAQTPSKRRVVFFGDSRIEGWQPMPALGGTEIINRGLSGQTTAQALFRLDEDILALKPQAVVVQCGVNDLKAIGIVPHLRPRLAANCLAHLEAMAERMRAEGIQVIMLTVFPVGRVPWARRLVWSDEIVSAIDETNSALRRLARPGVIVLDCDPVLRDGPRIKEGYARDTLHLNAAGYAALNAFLTPTLEKMICGAANEVPPDAL